ncbi:MAG: hypothetical protein MUP30_05560 [Deltaproteobacteria bacterium]|jgi:hypothetical protein|nr:hypothetical protein [Deltaproteobacteria bacterium]
MKKLSLQLCRMIEAHQIFENAECRKKSGVEKLLGKFRQHAVGPATKTKKNEEDQ